MVHIEMGALTNLEPSLLVLDTLRLPGYSHRLTRADIVDRMLDRL
jgi:hypothetical protein